MNPKISYSIALTLALVLTSTCLGQNQSEDVFTRFSVAGLNIKLPSKPKPYKIDLDDQKNLLEEHVHFSVVINGETEIVISRYKYRSDTELDFMTNLERIIKRFEGKGTVTRTKIDGIDAGLAHISHEDEGHEFVQRFLEFSQGRTYWKIHIAGADVADLSQFSHYSDIILKSVTVDK